MILIANLMESNSKKVLWKLSTITYFTIFETRQSFQNMLFELFAIYKHQVRFCNSRIGLISFTSV